MRRLGVSGQEAISTSDERFLLRLGKRRKRIMGKRREKVGRSCVEGDEGERGASWPTTTTHIT